MPISLTERDGVLFLSVKVVPGASRDRVIGALGEALKVSVRKPASEGAANRAVIELFAEFFGHREKDFQIHAGHTHPNKVLQIQHLPLATARETLIRKGIERPPAPA